MPCFHPLKAYRTRDGTITFNATKSLTAIPFALPCGQCIGCRNMKSAEWATRCIHEAKMHPRNVFVTLTYNQESVPEDYSLKLRDLQLFMKRLRKAKGLGVRFFGVGEYGDLAGRPHYHLLLFNCDFHSKQVVKVSKYGPVYTSPELAKLWTFGSHEIGSVGPESAGYVCRYSMKKITGDRADDHYRRTSPIDGKTYQVTPEFAVMSRRPGIGATWFDKYGSDAFPSDFLVVNGQRRKPPRYYLNKLSEVEQTPIKRARKRTALKQRSNNTKERLAVREEIQVAKLKLLKRKL